MKVYSQLEKAQLENLSSDLSGTITGAVWFNTTEVRAKFANGTSAVALLANDGKAVFGTDGTAGNNVRFHRGAATLLQIVVGSDTTSEGTLSTALAQLSSRLENYTNASRPAVGNAGRLIWNTQAGKPQLDDGSTWRDVAVGSSSGGGASGIETLQQKLELEKQNLFTEDLDNSIGISGQIPVVQSNFKATLLKAQSTSDTSIEVVWNAEAVNQSDQNMDSTTGWSTTGQAVSLTATSTAGEFQVGSSALKFDKSGSGTEAAVRFDNGSQTRQYNGLSRVWMYVKLPSVTNLSNVLLRIYADTTSNFQTFTKTTDFAGNALAIGWNLLVFDISTGGSAGGTGWDITKLSRYTEVGITTSTSVQTYTGVIFDSVYFSYFDPSVIGVVGTEYTLFNNSTSEDVVVAASNTLSDGRLTLVSGLSNGYSGGLTGSSRARVQRSVVDMTGVTQLPMDNDSTFSGTITTTQSLRYSTFTRQTISGDVQSFVDMIAIMAFKVTAIGGSTIDVSDPADLHLNMLNGDTFDFFRPVYTGGKLKYDYLLSRSLTANSTASGGTTTLTVTPTSLQVGDIAAKRHLASHSISVVAETAAESFSSATLKSSPDGIQLLDTGIDYPNRAGLYGHWALGGINATDAVRNRASSTPGPSITVTGTVNTAGSFQRGRFSAVGNNDNTNYLGIASPASGLEPNATLVQMSMWLYFDGTNGSNRGVLVRTSSGSNGFYCYILSGSSNLSFQVNSTAVTVGTLNVGWNHVGIVVNNGGSSYALLNGVRSATISATPTAVSTVFSILTANALASYTGQGLRGADLITWVGGSVITDAQFRALWNGGYFRPVGFGPMQRYMYTTTGQSGQKISSRVRVTRSTTAVTPTVWKTGTLISP